MKRYVVTSVCGKEGLALAIATHILQAWSAGEHDCATQCCRLLPTREAPALCSGGWFHAHFRTGARPLVSDLESVRAGESVPLCIVDPRSHFFESNTRKALLTALVFAPACHACSVIYVRRCVRLQWCVRVHCLCVLARVCVCVRLRVSVRGVRACVVRVLMHLCVRSCVRVLVGLFVCVCLRAHASVCCYCGGGGGGRLLPADC
jgi:hypothetical protein